MPSFSGKRNWEAIVASFSDRVWPWLLAAGVLLFCLYTVAPTVLWGDDAYFQRAAFTAELRPDGSGHRLWLQLAQLFLHVPWGDVAFRANLLSAVAAAVTVLVGFLAACELGLRTAGASVAALSLAVGHTLWMKPAVRAGQTALSLLVEDTSPGAKDRKGSWIGRV